MNGKFKPIKPYLLGAALIALGVLSFLSDKPATGKLGLIDPASMRAGGVVLIAGGAWTLISALRRR